MMHERRREIVAGGGRRLAALLLLALASRAPAQLVVPEGSAFRNGSTIPLEDEGGADDLLVDLDLALVAGDAEDAARIVRALRSRAEPALVRLGPRTHVPAMEKAARMVAARAGGGILERIADDARRALDEARLFRDVEALLGLALRGRELPLAREAAWDAARLVFESGRWWEAASLAARQPDRPGADALLEAARRHLPAPRAEPEAHPWTWAFSFSFPFDPVDEVAMPVLLDGRPGESLLLDHDGLVGFDLRPLGDRLRQTFDRRSWREHVLGAERFLGISPPAPRSHGYDRAGDRLVVPFNVCAETRYRGWRDPEARREARLLALDLGEPPATAWVGRLPGEPASTAFGPCRIDGDRVFTQVFRVGLQTTVSLAAFSLADGRRLWETPLVRGAAIPRYAHRRAEVDVDDLDKRAVEGAVAVADGIVHACTGFGLVAAVDGVTGRIRHTFRYDRLFPLEKSRYDPAYLFDTGGWEHEPVRLFGRRVIVAPSDSRFLYMLAPEPSAEGYVIVEDPIERLDRGQIVGLLGDPERDEAPRVLATRRRDNREGLVLLEPDGHVAAASARLPADEPRTGRATSVGRLVMVPTALGVRIFDGAELSRPPALLPKPPDVPPVRSVHVLETGLVAVCADPPDRAVTMLVWRPAE